MKGSDLHIPGRWPADVPVPEAVRRFVRRHRHSPTTFAGACGLAAARDAISRETGVNAGELTRIAAAVRRLDAGCLRDLEARPIEIPPLSGLVAPEARRLEHPHVRPKSVVLPPGTKDPPRAKFHFDVLAPLRPWPRQEGPTCVGFGVAHAASVEIETLDVLSGLFAWWAAKQRESFPAPPMKGTWPERALLGITKHGICREHCHPAGNYRDDGYTEPSQDAFRDAGRHRIESFAHLEGLIGQPEIIRFMQYALAGCPEIGLLPHFPIIGVAVFEEHVTRESLFSGVRPLPTSQSAITGWHCLSLIGYFEAHGTLWFIGLENWGDWIGSEHPFGDEIPRNFGLVFYPASFFEHPEWFCDLSLVITAEEEDIFDAACLPPERQAKRSEPVRRSEPVKRTEPVRHSKPTKPTTRTEHTEHSKHARHAERTGGSRSGAVTAVRKKAVHVTPRVNRRLKPVACRRGTLAAVAGLLLLALIVWAGLGLLRRSGGALRDGDSVAGHRVGMLRVGGPLMADDGTAERREDAKAGNEPVRGLAVGAGDAPAALQPDFQENLSSASEHIRNICIILKRMTVKLRRMAAEDGRGTRETLDWPAGARADASGA